MSSSNMYLATKCITKVLPQRLFLRPPFCFPLPFPFPFPPFLPFPLISRSGSSLNEEDGFGAPIRCFTSRIPFLNRPSVALSTLSSGLVFSNLLPLSRYLNIPSSLSCIELSCVTHCSRANQNNVPVIKKHTSSIFFCSLFC
jgi:hypothetical protein